jgi:lysophospholipase L1-like esterase
MRTDPQQRQSILKRRAAKAFGLLLLTTLGASSRAATSSNAASALNLDRFQPAINAFVASDWINPPPRHAILFVGSSIFRQWTNLTAQMAPLPVFNRAFGGSRTAEVLHHMDRIVLPYEPRIIVYYCGSNDVNAGEPAAATGANFRQFVARVHERLPATLVFFVSINRAPQKLDRWNVVDEANRLAHEFCAGDRRLGFIDVTPALFDAQGNPRLDLYQKDQLHFKPPAYEAFAAIIKPRLVEAWRQLPPPAGDSPRK